MSGEESRSERLTRNWNELLQELRVVQTGTQVLTGFLLTVPFSARFTDLTDRQETAYLAVLVGATLTTGLVLAPVAFHRMLFRQHERPWIVGAADACAKAGLSMLALTSAGVVALVFDVVVGPTPAIVAGVASIVFFVALWGAIPTIFAPAGGSADRGGDQGGRHD